MISVTISNDIATKWIGEAVIAICHFETAIQPTILTQEFDSDLQQILQALRTGSVSADGQRRIDLMRQTFRLMPDMDPTRYRPASESLTRRCINAEFPRILPLVDVNNLLSITLCLPLGIYDLEKLNSPKWIYRIGDKQEQYLTFAGQPKNADGKLVLEDQNGIFGSPVADSGRASVSDQTRTWKVALFLPIETSIKDAEFLCTDVRSAFRRYLGITDTGFSVVGKYGMVEKG